SLELSPLVFVGKLTPKSAPYNRTIAAAAATNSQVRMRGAFGSEASSGSRYCEQAHPSRLAGRRCHTLHHRPFAGCLCLRLLQAQRADFLGRELVVGPLGRSRIALRSIRATFAANPAAPPARSRPRARWRRWFSDSPWPAPVWRVDLAAAAARDRVPAAQFPHPNCDTLAVAGTWPQSRSAMRR